MQEITDEDLERVGYMTNNDGDLDKCLDSWSVFYDWLFTTKLHERGKANDEQGRKGIEGGDINTFDQPGIAG